MDTTITDSPSERETGPERTGAAGSGASAVGPVADRPGRFGRLGERARTLNPGWWAALLTLLPALLMARRVAKSTQMQYQDYWPTLVRITNPDGSLHFRGLFSYQNEHPFFVPQVVYYLDAKLLNGTNHELGYFAIAMALASLAVLWFLLPSRWSPLARTMLMLAASAVLFCPTGAWNYLKGMSGTAWITANVFGLLGVLFARNRQTGLAVAAAALSLLSYGTGFAAPLAVVVVALLQRDRWWRWALPLGLFFGGCVVYKLTSNGGTTGKGVSKDPGLLAQTFLTNVSTLWDPSGSTLGLVAGAFGLVVLAVGFVTFWNQRAEHADLIPWWGVAAYALLSSGLISLSRSEAFLGDGAQARYVSLSGLFWIAVAVVGLRTLRTSRELTVGIAVIAAAVAVFWAGSPQLYQTTVSETPVQNAMAAGVRFNAADPFQGRLQDPPAVISRLKGLGTYPFTSDYTLGCGLKPEGSIELSKARSLPARLFGKSASLDQDRLVGSTREFTGWIHWVGHQLQCVVLTDSAGKIIGGGAVEVVRTDVSTANRGFPNNTGFTAVTPSSNSDAKLVLGFSDGFYTLPTLPVP
ncbi:MAG TPA: hypothetical protein VGB75_12395 [Jatrophihabitans sp.]|uniref:hypothetical protein n=1 Tax=Jatrophihabitans sp. TaxID=1932789 RepID=UPI002EDE674C